MLGLYFSCSSDSATSKNFSSILSTSSALSHVWQKEENRARRGADRIESGRKTFLSEKQEESTSADTSRTERAESAHTIRGWRCFLSHFLLPYSLRGGETCKEGFGGFTVRNLLNKTMPLVHPVVAAT